MYLQSSEGLPPFLIGSNLQGKHFINSTILNPSEMTVANAEFLAERSSLILLADPYNQAIVQAIKSKNPNCLIYAFLNFWFASFERFWNGDPTLFADFGLVDQDNQPMIYGGLQYPGLEVAQSVQMMDIRKDGYQKYCAEGTRKMVVDNDIDGAFIDTLTIEPPVNFYGPGQTPINDILAVWEREAEIMGAELRNAMPVGKHLMFNGMTRAPGQGLLSAPNASLLEWFDGVAFEIWSRGSDALVTDADREFFLYTTVFADILQLLLNGKRVLVEMTMQEYTPEKTMFFLACMALIQNGNLFPNVTEDLEAGTNHNRDEYGIPHDDPEGPMEEISGGVYKRQFTNGAVFVNGTTEPITTPFNMAPFSATWLMH